MFFDYNGMYQGYIQIHCAVVQPLLVLAVGRPGLTVRMIWYIQ